MSKYYQEELYLKGDRTSLDTIEKFKKERQDKIDIENIKYEDTIKKYYEYLSLVSKLLQELNLSTSIEYSLAISYLIHKGYLTDDLSFILKNTELDLVSNLGISILTGEGCCRNISDIHYELMSRLGYTTKKIYCNRELLLFKGKDNPADHVMSLIRYHKTLYGIDLMNGNQLFHFKSPYCLEGISLRDSRRYHYKPYVELIMDESSLEDVKKTIKRFSLEVSKPWISSMEYQDEIVYPTKQYLNSCNEKFYDFHEKTKTLKKEIATTLRKEL